MTFFLRVLMVVLVNTSIFLIPKNQGMAQFSFTMGEKGLIAQITPQSYQDYFNRGNLHFRSGNFDKALADYTQGIIINPNHHGLYFNRALTQRKLEDYEGALEDMNLAIALSPSLAGYLQRGYIYGELGDIHRALADFQHTANLAEEIGSPHLLQLAREAISRYSNSLGI